MAETADPFKVKTTGLLLYLTLDLFISATEELLRQGANPNLVEFSGASAFHVAVGLDNLELSEDVTRLILQYGGDPNVRYVT